VMLSSSFLQMSELLLRITRDLTVADVNDQRNIASRELGRKIEDWSGGGACLL